MYTVFTEWEQNEVVAEDKIKSCFIYCPQESIFFPLL